MALGQCSHSLPPRCYRSALICLPSTMSLKEKANALRWDVDRLLAGGGTDIAIPILTAINAASDAFPPLKGPTGAALFIFSEVQKFKSDRKEWKEFGKYVVDAAAKVLMATESYDTSTEEAKPWLENVNELNDALKQITTEIEPILAKMKKRSIITNFLSNLVHPGRIDDFTKVLDKALASFQLRTSLTTGAKLTDMANNQSRDSVLGELRYPTIAHHDPAEGCMEGTRTDLVDRIMSWCRNMEDDAKRVMLLTAVAGAGKTSVAHSIAAKCKSEGLLLLSFFFKAGEQSRPDRLFSGMARSLAKRDPSYCASIISILRDDPTLATASFPVQFEKLVAGPLRWRAFGDPVVVIVDALDECEPRDLERLADILRNEVPKSPSNIKFFVTSRQTYLVDRLLSPNFPIDRFGIDILDNANKQDCSVYIRAQLRCLKNDHSGQGDEFEEDLLVQNMSEKAGGLFIWISTVFRYVRLAKKPRKTLDRLLNPGASRSTGSPEGVMGTLYTTILDKCGWDDEDFVHDYPIVMGAILIAEQPLSIVAWDAILSPILNSSIHDTLVELSPLLLGVSHSNTPIRIIHHRSMTLRFTEILNKDLCCVEGLGLIEDLPKKDELPRIRQEMLSEQLRYSCRCIVYHLDKVLEPLEALSGSVLTFLNQHITRWVEVCVRTEGYISVSSFPEWAKLGVDRNSEEDIHKLVQVLDKVRRNLSFFSRFQEAHELAKDSVTLCRYLVFGSITQRSYVSLDNLGRHSEALPVIEECVKLQCELVAVDPMLYTPDLARSLHNLYVSLGNLGRHSEALPVIEESVKLWRELITVHPTSYTPHLAQSLNSLKISLENLGRYSEALPVIEESVKLWRELIAVHPTSYTPNLAFSLHNLDGSLTRLGRHSDALAVNEESVKLWRELVAIHPTSYTPDLARSLNSLMISLDNLGHHSEALLAIEESVKLWRELVVVHPTSYNPDLARSLNNLMISLDNLGHYSEALLVIEESVKLWRELVVVHPTSYNPNLARSLHSLNESLRKVGHHSEALLVIEESVKLWRELVTVHPTSYTPNLAQSLDDLNISLVNLGRYSEALSTIKEGVKLWRELVAVHPTSYNPHLAESLHILALSFDYLDCPAKAAPFIEESISLWRSIHITHPIPYAADLAWALRDLSRILSRLGHYAEAFDVGEEAILYSHQLRSEYPDIYANYLRQLYANMAAPLEALGRGHELADIRTLMQNL
ncbi:uncharacterized protein EI90DRAFT_3056353 [Cantharellus anzutake]|uniref:uncharacterized protein n=1 Tax=Cantharellus anzutake TaxID=1750568 RepID=UPI0019036474|nr:uncharacterized protein EI90DRAFT_3056353 [Cantharellus anzutake]KAF8332042.1 hypothetical protein EI90DRAFT_3056353 [Cantharellus anzutake]